MSYYHIAGFGWEESNSIGKVGVLFGVNITIHKWDLYSVFSNISKFIMEISEK